MAAEMQTSDLVRANGEGLKVHKRPIKKSPTTPLSADEVALKKRQQEANDQYGRGKAIQIKSVRDKKLRANLRALNERSNEAALKAKDAEILLENSSGFLEPRTW